MMTGLTSELARPRGRYGVDGDYRLIPAPVVFGGYLLMCLAAGVLAGMWLMAGRILPGVGAAVVTAVLVGVGLSIVRFSRRGKFEVWARLLTRLGLRGDERVLDLGCGRGAVLLTAAKLVPRGSAVGVDIWRADQTGNSMEATLANADAEGVADRIEVHTADMTDLRLPDGSFDLIVSSLAIHNLPGRQARLSAIDEAVRVLRPGGRVVIADLGFTRLYATRLRERGMVDVKREDLGWRAWWGLPLIRLHAVTATKPQSRRYRKSRWRGGEIVTAESVSRVVALEEAFLHPRVWDVFPEALQHKYQPVKARLSDVGSERIRLMDAAGIDVQVLSHVAPGVQILADVQAELAVAISREVNDWLADAIAAHPARFAGFAMLPTQSPTDAADGVGADGSRSWLQGRADQRTHQRALP